MGRPCLRSATSRNSAPISTRWCEADLAEAILFYLFAIGALFAGAQVIFRRNPIYGALSLVVALFFLSRIYVQPAAHLIAILEIIVYAGAVMVLFVFVIMLLNLKDEELGERRVTFWKAAGGAGIAAAVGILVWTALRGVYPEKWRDLAFDEAARGFGGV